jgi:hypothetical protein
MWSSALIAAHGILRPARRRRPVQDQVVDHQQIGLAQLGAVLFAFTCASSPGRYSSTSNRSGSLRRSWRAGCFRQPSRMRMTERVSTGALCHPYSIVNHIPDRDLPVRRFCVCGVMNQPVLAPNPHYRLRAWGQLAESLPLRCRCGRPALPARRALVNGAARPARRLRTASCPDAGASGPPASAYRVARSINACASPLSPSRSLRGAAAPPAARVSGPVWRAMHPVRQAPPAGRGRRRTQIQLWAVRLDSSVALS